jgi:hypothetical protein
MYLANNGITYLGTAAARKKCAGLWLSCSTDISSDRASKKTAFHRDSLKTERQQGHRIMPITAVVA